MSNASAPAPLPVLIYDGDCGICTRLVEFARRRLRPAAALRPSGVLDVAAYGLTDAECAQALQFVADDGRVHSAQNAVSQLLLASGRVWRPAGHLLRLPGVNALAGLGYRWVARNRYRLPGGTAACVRPPGQRDPGRGNT